MWRHGWRPEAKVNLWGQDWWNRQKADRLVKRADSLKVENNQCNYKTTMVLFPIIYRKKVTMGKSTNMVLFPKEKVRYSTWYFFSLVLFPIHSFDVWRLTFDSWFWFLTFDFWLLILDFWLWTLNSRLLTFKY